MENRFVRKVMVTGGYGSCRAVRSCTGKVGFGKAWLGYGKMENVKGGQSVLDVRKVKAMSGVMQSYRAS